MHVKVEKRMLEVLAEKERLDREYKQKHESLEQRFSDVSEHVSKLESKVKADMNLHTTRLVNSLRVDQKKYEDLAVQIYKIPAFEDRITNLRASFQQF